MHRNAFFLVPCVSSLVPVIQFSRVGSAHQHKRIATTKTVGKAHPTILPLSQINTGMTGVGRMFDGFTILRGPDYAALHPGYHWVHRNAFFLVPCVSSLVPVIQFSRVGSAHQHKRIATTKTVGKAHPTILPLSQINTGMTGVGRMFDGFTILRDPDSAALHPGYRGITQYIYRITFFLVPCTSPLVPVTLHNVYYVK